MTRGRGLTLTEFVVATSIVLVIASVAVPNAVSRRMQANESSAIAALGQIASAQARFQAAGYVDINNNGVGEYGLLRELTGVVAVRNDAIGWHLGERISRPLLPRSFARFNVRGEALRAGYLFHVALPAAAGVGVVENEGRRALASFVDSDLAERTWACYAWPARYGVTGTRTFFANETGEVVQTHDTRYSGSNAFRSSALSHRDNLGAAFVAGGAPSNITGQIAIGTRGRDGNVWRRAGPRRPSPALRAGRDEGYRLGAFEIVVHRASPNPYETMFVRTRRARGASCDLILIPAHGGIIASFGTAIAGTDGLVEFHFDSRHDTYPEGVATLLTFERGYIDISSDSHREFDFAFWIGKFHRDVSAELLGHSPEENEAAAVATLREVATAQAQFQASGICDVYQDGIGEFGLFRELSGAVGVRDNATAGIQGSVMDPPVLPRAFRTFNENHDVSRSGYLFHMILPGAAGIGVPEVSGTASLWAALDSDLAETTWCCYAWPVEYGRTGSRAFFINQTGTIVATDNPLYSGSGDFTASNSGAAFVTGGPLAYIVGPIAVGTIGRDGLLWRRVPNRLDEHAHSIRGDLAPRVSGLGTSGKFSVAADLLPTATDEAFTVRATGLAARTTHTVRLIDATGGLVADFGLFQTDADGRGRFRFDSTAVQVYLSRQRRLELVNADARIYPPGIDSITVFAGGTLEVRDAAGVVVLSGAIPPLATVGGPPVPDSSVMFHATGSLDPTPPREIENGKIDVGVTNEPGGSRETLRISVTTFDVAERRLDVVAIDALGAETTLGTIVPDGFDGAGALAFDTRGGRPVPGGVASLSGVRIEVRSRTGDIVVAGTFPIVR